VSVDAPVIERVITIEAAPETVFRLLTDSREYAKWKGERAQLDARPGGIFRVIFPQPATVVAGKFIELVPQRRVVFSWGWEGNEHVPPGSSRVEIDLEPVGSGTRLRLVHRDLPVPALAQHAEGWDMFLPRLTAVAEGRPAGTDIPSAIQDHATK
jgi:uncharacterized protein YndB with AHSA1/START domain